MRKSKPSRTFRTTTATVALAGALLMGSAAQAQETAEDSADEGGIQTLVVTAQFREQNVQDTPIAITAIDAGTLDARGQSSVADLGDFAPNVALEPASGIQGNSIAAFIRGVGQSDGSFAFEPGVGVYIDDIYYGTMFGAVMDLTDLERVEVLRGPQGTLSGKNSVGGSVKLFTKKPDGSGDSFVEVAYGSYDRLDIKASADFMLTDELYARISGISKTADGYMKRLDYGCVFPDSGIAPVANGSDDCVLGTEGGRDVQAVRLALRYDPYDAPIEINLNADYATDNSEIVPSKLIYADSPNDRSYVAGDPYAGIPFDDRFITGPESYTSYANYMTGGNYTTVFGIPYQVAPGGFTSAPKATAESWGVSGRIDVELADNLSLTSITGFRSAEGTSGIDIDGSPISVMVQELDFSHEQFTQELRLSGQFADGLIDATLGGFYYHANDALGGRSAIPTLLFDFYQDDKVTNESISAFGHVEVHLTDRFNLIGGLRYTNDDKSYTYTRRNPDGSPVPEASGEVNFAVYGLDGLDGGFSGDRVDYRIGANYEVFDNMMVYAQVSTGYKGGGINPRPSAEDQVTSFGPEIVTTYEAGFKTDLLDRSVRLNGAVFLNDYSDIQLIRYNCPESDVISCSMPANAGDAEILGFELETTIQPIDGLQIDGSLGYLDFDYTDITDASTQVTMDMVAPFISKWQLSAGIQYEAELASGATITPRVDWNFRSSFQYNSINTVYTRIDDYSLVNARLTFRSPDRDWSASVGVTNLFDKFYYTGLAENIASFGVATGNPGRPREWSVSVRRNF